MRAKRLATFAVGILVVSSLLAPGAASASALDDPFYRTWSRTDEPVNQGVTARTWVWGPLGTAYRRTEEYAESPDGKRTVMYFDKARMEVNDPAADPDDLWFVTNGLLVVEMMNGQLQVGDNAFEPRQPATIGVAGDPDDTGGPTYATMAALRGTAPLAADARITQRVSRNGAVTDDPDLWIYNVRAGPRVTVPGIDHRVANVFWDFMTSVALVNTGDGYAWQQLFVNPFYGTGFPLTEAYWANVKVAGTVHPVLVQCFERRCLTYSPQNPPGWIVETGNVGRHYYAWRYGHPLPGDDSATVYLVALGDTSGDIVIGCGDSLIPVGVGIWPTAGGEERIAATVEVLLGIERDYGQSGLTNALYRADVTLDSVTIAAGTATLNFSGAFLLGGVCDTPRAEGQIRHTVLETPGITDVVIRLNGQPWPGSGG